MTASFDILPSSPRYQIASCGMGSVYIGIQRGAAGFKRPVAIKRAHPYLLEDPAFRDTILREARNASAVRHPNVISVDDVEETDGELLLDMDDVEGTWLSHVLASRTALGAPVAVRIVMDVCSALNAIHGARSQDGGGAKRTGEREIHDALEASMVRIVTRDQVADLVLGVAGTMLDQHRRSINLARASARPPSELAFDDFVPGEADIFGMATSELDERDVVPAAPLRPFDPRIHRRFDVEADLDEGLVPSSRLAMPERVSIVM